MQAHPQFEKQIHQRLLANDPIAPSELANAYLGPVAASLRASFKTIDEAMIHDAAADAILNYAENPSRYDPAKSKLLTYLKMSAKGDLLNALAREKRRNTRLILVADVEKSPSRRNIRVKEKEPSGPEGPEEDLVAKARGVLTGTQDRQVLELMLDGERRTDVYASILGLGNLSKEKKQRIVKRHKDRINKRLRRLGVKLRGQTNER